jgi:sugar lactone lactonase YvrE
MSLRAALPAVALLLAACSSSPPAPSPPLNTATASAATPSESATPAATPTATPTLATLAECPSQPVDFATLPVLHRGGTPDDLWSDGAGGIWVSDTTAGTVYHLGAAGGVDHTFSGFSSPEGVVLLSDGSLLVAEQGRNRVVTVHPDGSRTVFATLPPPPAGAEGVDGIGWDAAGGQALIPDSPHGTMLIAAASGAAQQVASGLGRPVGAAIGPDGSLLVTAENAAPRGLLRIGSGGTVTHVGNLRQLDDIVVLHGLVYVTDLAAGSVHAVDPTTGADRTIGSGIGQPQGLTALPDGRLAVADSKSGGIRVFSACG